MQRLTLVALALFLGILASDSTAQLRGLSSTTPDRPNFLIILIDDMGVDIPSAYGEGANTACMPNLEQLAAQGMLFRNAWAMSACSPTRATLLTGTFPFRHGLGTLPRGGAGLLPSELILPEMLATYDNAQIGKWHLQGNLGSDHPNQMGFHHYSGSLGGGLGDYWNWSKVVNGLQQNETRYATTVATDESIDAMQTLHEPWLLVTSYNAIHSDFHEAPEDLCPESCSGSACGNLDPDASNAERARSMAEALDREMGRLVNAVDAIAPNTYVFVIGDNGTPRTVTQAPFNRNHAKGSLYEGGVNVPFVVRGPQVSAGAECRGLVSVADVFATLADLSGTNESTPDSISLVPYFAEPFRPSLRQYVYAERFTPPHATLPIADHTRTVRNYRYKLIRDNVTGDELYDLHADPFETTDLLPDLTAAEQANYQLLQTELKRLGTD